MPEETSSRHAFIYPMYFASKKYIYNVIAVTRSMCFVELVHFSAIYDYVCVDIAALVL